jgi:hypothetical protein
MSDQTARWLLKILVSSIWVASVTDWAMETWPAVNTLTSGQSLFVLVSLIIICGLGVYLIIAHVIGKAKP